MNTQNVWIKRSEREPTEADLPIVMGGYMCGSGKAWDIALYTCLPPKSHWSGYWRSIKADPPARELTQRERDVQWANDLSVKVIERCALVTRPLSIEYTLAGIYAERREISRMLEVYYGCDKWGDATYQPGLQLVRARLDEQGAK